MALLIVAGVVAVAIGVLAFLTWLVLRFFGKRLGRRVFKTALVVWLICLPVLFFIVAPILTSNLVFSGAGTRPRDVGLERTPQNCGRAYQDVRFPSRDGIQLSGWLMDGQADLPAIVLSHGLFRNRHEVLDRGCALNNSGYPVLLFDFRGHGSHEGKSGRAGTTLGFNERLDVEGAVDLLRSRRSNPDVVLMGVSMGAVADLLAAPDLSPPPVAVIADSPFQNLHKTVARHAWLLLKLPSFPFTQVFCWNLSRMAGFDPDQFDTLAALRKVPQVPVLLIYGSDDKRMPKETARAVYQGIPSPRKDLEFFDKATHGKAYEVDPQRYIRLVLDFLSTQSGLGAGGRRLGTEERPGAGG